MKDFRTLQVWERAHQHALAIYRATRSFPKEELYGLTSQIRRSSSSIPTNIAEGCGRNSDAELYRFMVIAMGSASELEYQLLFCKDVGFIDEVLHEDLTMETIEIRKMLSAFIKTLSKSRSEKRV